MPIRRNLTFGVCLILFGVGAAARGQAPGLGPVGQTNGSADLAPPDLNPWSAWDKVERAPKKAAAKSEGEWGALTAQTTVQDGWAPSAWEEPAWKRTWQTNESYHLPLTGPLFVFGQLGANSGEAAQQDMQVTGQTGLACKLPQLGPVADVQVRSGPRLAYTDPLRPDRTSSRSDWLLEVQARLPLVARVGLEYQGTAAPALTPVDHDWVNQDIHLAFPVGAAGKFQLGAKHKWQDTAGSRTGADSTQLYMGLELSR
ncbi:MAG TPA: hypothetical protein VFE78_21345 [Gemmataceae bacterium]|jgi:hypothetical protein|nr:hypothetical protein [Gemmataceae bacterium]